MKSRTKKMLMGILGILVILFAIWLTVFATVTLKVDAAKFWVDNQTAALDVLNFVESNVALLIFVGVIAVGSYYFLIYRPKTSRVFSTNRRSYRRRG